jgi:uncharacterized membrane protein
MKINKYEKLNLIVALLFAVFMLVTAYFMQGSEYKQTVMLLLIALWFVPFSCLNKKSKSKAILAGRCCERD